jgi:hypothetical protein
MCASLSMSLYIRPNVCQSIYVSVHPSKCVPVYHLSTYSFIHKATQWHMYVTIFPHILISVRPTFWSYVRPSVYSYICVPEANRVISQNNIILIDSYGLDFNLLVS